MPFTAEIRRNNPTCFLFLVDQSSSMLEPFAGNQEKNKAQGVADAINRLLQNLALKCAKSDGIRDYFHVGVIGYGGNQAMPAFSGTLAARSLAPISEIARNPVRVEQRSRKVDDGAGGVMEQKFKFPVWFEPVAKGKTPMCQALQMAHSTVAEFLKNFPNCYPPLVVNISDGAATDGDPEKPAANLRNLASTDGNLLLLNAHLSSKELRPIEYPDREEGLPDKYAQLLFRMSSLLPPKLLGAAKAEGFVVTPASRGFVFNADLVAIVRFLDIGTQVATTVQHDVQK
ncbi:MAG: VWA domain-containing protein [Gemmataceae bacterium]|nr:VWA domain-containing protein [Gemmataceae bacterium]